MFELGVGNGFVLCTTLLLLVCAALATYDFWRASVHGWELSKERLGYCSACRLRFIVSRHERVVRCPQCNELCSRTNR